MTATTTDQKDTFVTVPGDRRSEVARTLAEPVPQALSLLDQFGLWGNLGVSLLGFTGAIFVLQPGGPGTPELSLAAALTAIVAGTVFGTAVLALAGLPGARTGAPAMVLLRGLFGARLSYLPTALNILQCLGWAVFELVTIATAAHTVAPALPKWGYVLIAGVATRADHPAAGRHPGPAPVRGRRRAGRHVLPVRAAHPAPAAGAHARHLVRLLGGHRYGRGGGHLVRAAGGRLHPALPQPPGRLRRDHGRLLRHPGALLRHRAARLGHRGARPLAGHLRRVHRAAARRAGLRHLGHPGAGPVVRRRLLHRGLDAEHAPAVGPADPGGHDRRAGHGGRAVAQHRRLRELPRPHRLAVRAAVGGPDHGLLRHLARPLGPVRGGPRPLAHAAALGRRVRHLPAHQSRLRVLVGRGLDVVRPRPRLHPGQLDVGLDPVLRRSRRDHRAGLAGWPGAPPRPSPAPPGRQPGQYRWRSRIAVSARSAD